MSRRQTPVRPMPRRRVSTTWRSDLGTRFSEATAGSFFSGYVPAKIELTFLFDDAPKVRLNRDFSVAALHLDGHGVAPVLRGHETVPRLTVGCGDAVEGEDLVFHLEAAAGGDRVPVDGNDGSDAAGLGG